MEDARSTRTTTMKLVFILSALLLISSVFISTAAAEGQTVDPECQAACYGGRAAFIAWCRGQGSGAPCLALVNAPPQLFTIPGCLRYCNT